MATERLQVYQCPHCGNTVEVIRAGGGELVCCGEAMQLLTENTTDAATEKHVPVVERVAGGINVKVGEANHPMVDGHWIEWIEVVAGERAYREFLNPGDAPEAFFPVEDEEVTVREICNLHGLWKAN